MANVYIDFHVLQTVPPSCVNRDDTGSPKTAVYGGVNRSRVSSQAWKRAMRVMFKDILPNKEDIGVRTKKISSMIIEALKNNGVEGDLEKQSKKILDTVGIKYDEKKNNDCKALFFMSYGQANALAKLVKEGKTDKKEYLTALKSEPSIDLVLFGRMVADEPSLNYDACAQVAHAISTHSVSNEYDYFTAVDDLQKEDNAGAGHLGTVEFDSSTMYRYATVCVTELKKHLQDDYIRAIQGFAKAFICSMPTGKQNTFANRTLPDLVYVTIREDQPINLCGAFEKAIPATINGFVEESISRLQDYAKNIYSNFVSQPKYEFVISEKSIDWGMRVTLETLNSEIEKHLNN